MTHGKAVKLGGLNRQWLARCINSEDEITVCVVAANDGAISISLGFDSQFVLELSEEFISEFWGAFTTAIAVVETDLYRHKQKRRTGYKRQPGKGKTVKHVWISR